MAVLRSDRRLRGLAAAVVAGLAAALLYELLAPARYEATATVLVAHGGRLPASSPEALQGARTVAALAAGETVARAVASALRIAPPQVTASPRGSSGLVELHVRTSSAATAVRAAQQAGLVVSQLVATRFSTSGVSATIWEPAQAAERVRPSAASAAGAAVLAALAALAAVALLGRRRVPPRPLVEGRLHVAALERRAAAEAGRARADELRAYAKALRAHADEHGVLPATVEPVVRQIFDDDR